MPGRLATSFSLPIRARLESMDLSLEVAAADLYATPFKAFLLITLPLLWPGIIAGLMYGIYEYAGQPGAVQ